MPAIGAIDRAAVERELRVAHGELGIAQRELGFGQLHRRDRRWRCAAPCMRSSLGLCVVERDLGAVERDLLGFGIEPGDDLALLDLRAGLRPGPRSAGRRRRG